MRTARFSDAVFHNKLNRPPWTEIPQKEHGTRDKDPLEGTWDQAASQEVIS